MSPNSPTHPPTHPPTLEHLIALAAQVHAGQVDKAGEPYILHVLRVMFRVIERWPHRPEAAIVAVLHDMVEDTSVTLEWLLECGVPAKLVDAVHVLTRQKEFGSYQEYVIGCAANDLAYIVKRSDLEDHLRPNGMLSTGHACNLRARYQRALTALTQAYWAKPMVKDFDAEESQFS